MLLFIIKYYVIGSANLGEGCVPGAVRLSVRYAVKNISETIGCTSLKLCMIVDIEPKKR